MLALSWKRAFSEQVTKAEAVKSVGALSAFKAGPGLAFAIGAIPKKRNAESRIDKRRLMILISSCCPVLIGFQY